MSKWSDAVDVELKSFYGQVPEIGCKGLCADSCGPIAMGHRENQRIKQAGVRIPSRAEGKRLFLESDGEWSCPALSPEGRCTVYEIRPMICRIWGAAEDLRCPYGCGPEQDSELLAVAKAHALLEKAMWAGTVAQPVPEEHFQAVLDTPEGKAVHESKAIRPVRDRKASRRKRGL